MITAQDIVRTARSYLGTRWRHQGRSGQGVDCIGLVLAVAHDLGLSDLQVDGYARQPDPRQLRAGLQAHMTLRSDESHQPGDVLLLSLGAGGQHVGIATDTGLIHAAAIARRVVEHRMDELWLRRVMGAYAWRGVRYG